MIGSALTGGPLAAKWAPYCSIGIESAHFDLHPAIFEMRSLLQSYRLAGLVCEEDPTGVAQPHAIPGTQGITAIITTDDGPILSRNSHTPHTGDMSLVDERIERPMCAGLDRKPTSYEKLTILGGRVSLRNEEMDDVLREHIAI